MIINRIYETQNLLSLQFVSFLVRLRTYQHPYKRQTAKAFTGVVQGEGSNRKYSSNKSQKKLGRQETEYELLSGWVAQQGTTDESISCADNGNFLDNGTPLACNEQKTCLRPGRRENYRDRTRNRGPDNSNVQPLDLFNIQTIMCGYEELDLRQE